MRPLLFALLIITALAAVRPVQARTEYLHPDSSAAYVLPAGVEVVTDVPLSSNQAALAIVRTVAGRKERAGVCVLGVSTLSGMPNLQTWAGMIAAHRTDTEAKARAKVKAPLTFVSLGGYRDLVLRGGGDGYAFWFQQRRADGLEETRLNAVGLIKPQSLFSADCLSTKGTSFTQGEIDRILKLVNSTRRP